MSRVLLRIVCIITYGVNVWSVLGPILFLICVIELCSAKLNGRLTAFAHDTALSYSSTSLNRLKDYMQENLNCLEYWF